MLNKKQFIGFTIVELIVSITILSILATIGMVTYTGYLKGVRDINRISQLKNLSDTLNLFKAKYTLPLPENSVDVIANGVVIAYQGYLGKNIIDKIGYSNEGVDPKIGNYFSYYLTKDRKNFQLMGFLEESPTLQASLINGLTLNANSDEYEFTFPIVQGKKLGILTTEFNKPIQEEFSIRSNGYIDLGGTNSGTIFTAHIKKGKEYTFSGTILENKLQTFSKPGIYGPPNNCRDGFIGVWGDAGFNQVGFCISKYEMTYSDADIPDSCDTQDPEACTTSQNRNTVRYIIGKVVTSMTNKYAIANLTQQDAIYACQTLGKGYHLVTNNEWMSIARNIEYEDDNWSSGKVGYGYIGLGLSNSDKGCGVGTSQSTYPELLRTRAGLIGSGSNIGCNGLRKLLLYGGEYIYDFVGNVDEHVNKANTLYGSDYNLGQTALGTVDNTWVGWDGLEISQNERDIYGPLIGINLSNGIGEINDVDGTTDNIFRRGGGAYEGDDNGIFNLVLKRNKNSQTRSLGFRCAKLKD